MVYFARALQWKSAERGHTVFIYKIKPKQKSSSVLTLDQSSSSGVKETISIKCVIKVNGSFYRRLKNIKINTATLFSAWHLRMKAAFKGEEIYEKLMKTWFC